jgi:hypothetical protein
MQKEPNVLFMRVLIKIVDSLSIKRRGAPNDAVNLVALLQE